MSNKGLNSNEALEESTATNSSVTLSGIRREKETPTDLDIENYRLDPGNSDPWEHGTARHGESVSRRISLEVDAKSLPQAGYLDKRRCPTEYPLKWRVEG